MSLKRYTFRLGRVLPLVVLLPCVASVPAPFEIQCALVDDVGRAVAAAPALSSAGLEALSRVVEGRMDQAPPDLEVRLGLRAGQLRGPEFRDARVRSRAIQRIGESAIPGALEYLNGLRRDQFPDRSANIWAVVQVAIRQAQLNRISGEAAKRSFLEQTAREKSEIALWAIEQLCDSGSSDSLDIIRASLPNFFSAPRREEQIAFCETRIAVLARSSDRATALASALRVADIGRMLDHREIVSWAINELEKLESPVAVTALEQFAADIEAANRGAASDTLVASHLSSRRDQLQRALTMQRARSSGRGTVQREERK